MAIILTKKVETESGIQLTDVYINVSEIYINKTNNSIQIVPVAYANKKARNENKKPIVITDIGMLQSQISEDLDPNTDKPNTLAYKILNSKIKELRLTSKDDI